MEEESEESEVSALKVLIKDWQGWFIDWRGGLVIGLVLGGVFGVLWS